MPLCVKCVRRDFRPACPPITAITPAGPAAFRKSPNCTNNWMDSLFGRPFLVTSAILPFSRDTFLISLSRSNRFTVTMSPSAPLAGVEPVHPIASTCNLCRVGVRSSPSAVPRVHPPQSRYFSLSTFSRPFPFLFPPPHLPPFLPPLL